MKNTKVARASREVLAEARPSEDPIVALCASALVDSLTGMLESEEGDILVSNAFEYMMGSVPDEERLTLGRPEDIDAVAEIVVRDILRDASVHDALHGMAAAMLRSAMSAMRG